MQPQFVLTYRSYNDSIYKINEIVKEDRRFKAIIDVCLQALDRLVG
jgi:hypothetical protein